MALRLRRALAIVLDDQFFEPDVWQFAGGNWSDSLGSIKRSFYRTPCRSHLMRLQTDVRGQLTNKVGTFAVKKGQPDGIMLPMLPSYQEYGYDPDKTNPSSSNTPRRRRRTRSRKGFDDEPRSGRLKTIPKAAV